MPVQAFDIYDRESTVTYDGLGRPLRTESPDGSTTTIDYDLLGNVTHTQLPGGLFQVNEYDPLGRPTASFDYKGSTYTAGDTVDTIDQFRRYETTYHTSGTFRGLVQQTTDPRGRVSVPTYDKLFRTEALEIRDGSGGPALVTTEYSFNAARPLLDSIVQTNHERTDGSAVTAVAYRYDIFHQLRSEAIYTGDNAATILDSAPYSKIQHNFNQLGQVAEMKVDAGFPSSSVHYTYDAGARLTGYTWNPAQNTANGITSSYDYSVAGYLKERTDPFKTMASSERDGRGLIGRVDIEATNGATLATHRM
ncbi:MAG: RHS repeat protein, partial [Opitutales bacterium]|nr:RHS repeat protein [Opitutales bacterium]